MKKAADVIIDCLAKKNMSQRQLAREMGEDVRYLNQQLHRQKDMKVERFADVLEHIGFHLEVVDDEDFRKATPELAKEIVETGEPHGLFYAQIGDTFIAVDSTHSELFMEEFSDLENCKKWLRQEECVDINSSKHFD